MDFERTAISLLQEHFSVHGSASTHTIVHGPDEGDDWRYRRDALLIEWANRQQSIEGEEGN